MKKNLKKQSITFILTVFLILSFSCSAMDLFGNDEEVIWRVSLNQYIKYAEQDSRKLGKNEHPIDLDEKQIGYSLKALEYEDDGLLSFSETIKPVFTSRQIKVLSENLVKGLRNASPEQDIIFVLEKAESKMLGLKEKTYLAGRAFYKNNKLNIIMGEYEFFRSEAFESTYDPGGQQAVPYSFNFGKRTKKSKSFEGKKFNAIGVNFNQLKGEQRSDWLLIDIGIASRAYIDGENKRNNPVTAADKKLEAEAAKLAKQRREMRAEMARMRKEVQDATSNKSSNAKSIEKRIETLDQLLSKKLITQEEYDTKRQEILSDI